MKSNFPFLKDAIYLVTLLVGVAVMWGMTSTRIDYIEKKVEAKADKELIETKLDYIIQRVDNIEDMLRDK
jgi:hypothetical protein|tara:strand:+ start:789 stop:998 length:210 start_codon:yes stop_codon:yes gene_type:complete